MRVAQLAERHPAAQQRGIKDLAARRCRRLDHRQWQRCHRQVTSFDDVARFEIAVHDLNSHDRRPVAPPGNRDRGRPGGGIDQTVPPRRRCRGQHRPRSERQTSDPHPRLRRHRTIGGEVDAAADAFPFTGHDAAGPQTGRARRRRPGSASPPRRERTATHGDLATCNVRRRSPPVGSARSIGSGVCRAATLTATDSRFSPDQRRRVTWPR